MILKAITRFLDARQERKLESIKLTIKTMGHAASLASSMMQMLQQHKCFTCKHKYEKQKPFTEGGVVAPSVQIEPEVILPPSTTITNNDNDELVIVNTDGSLEPIENLLKEKLNEQ